MKDKLAPLELYKSSQRRFPPNTPDDPYERPIEWYTDMSFYQIGLAYLTTLKGKLAPSSLALYTERLTVFCTDLLEQQITKEYVRKWVDGVRAKGTMQRAAYTQSLLKNVVKWAVDNKLVNYNFLKDLSPIRVVSPLKRERFTLAEYEKLKELSYGRRIYPILVIAWNTGLRRSDIINLKWGSIDFENQLISVKPIKTYRTKRMLACIPIRSGSELETLLLALRESAASVGPDDFLFPHYATEKKHNQVFENEFYKLQLRSGIKGKSMHTFRRTLASNLVSSGCDLITAAHILGLSDTNTLKRYVVPSTARMRDAMAKLEDFAKDQL